MGTHSEMKLQKTKRLHSYYFCILITLCILNGHSKLKRFVWNIHAAHEGVWSVCDDEVENSSFSSSFLCFSLTACHSFSLRPTLRLSPILWVVGTKNKIHFMCCWSFRSFSLPSILLSLFLTLSGGLSVEPYGECEQIRVVDGCFTPTQKRGACWMMPMNAWGQAGWKGTCGCVSGGGGAPCDITKKGQKSLAGLSPQCTPPPARKHQLIIHCPDRRGCACICVRVSKLRLSSRVHMLLALTEKPNISTQPGLWWMRFCMHVHVMACFMRLHKIWDAAFLLSSH